MGEKFFQVEFEGWVYFGERHIVANPSASLEDILEAKETFFKDVPMKDLEVTFTEHDELVLKRKEG